MGEETGSEKGRKLALVSQPRLWSDGPWAPFLRPGERSGPYTSCAGLRSGLGLSLKWGAHSRVTHPHEPSERGCHLNTRALESYLSFLCPSSILPHLPARLTRDSQVPEESCTIYGLEWYLVPQIGGCSRQDWSWTGVEAPGPWACRSSGQAGSLNQPL